MTDTINHTFIPLKETHVATLSIENVMLDVSNN